MGVSKVGLGSFLVGLILVLGEWFLGFASKGISHGIIALLTTALVGGVFWIGAVLILIGLLLLVL